MIIILIVIVLISICISVSISIGTGGFFLLKTKDKGNKDKDEDGGKKEDEDGDGGKKGDEDGDGGKKGDEDGECIFNAVKYEALYPDLKAAFNGNAEQLKNHYNTHGKNEGRSPCGKCDWDAVKYAALYKDVVNVYGNDPIKLKQHYDTHGKAEGRSPCGDKRTERLTSMEGILDIEPRKDGCQAGWEEIDSDLNKGCGGDTIKMCIKKGTSASGIKSLSITNTNCPNNTSRHEYNMKTGTGSKTPNLYLCREYGYPFAKQVTVTDNQHTGWNYAMNGDTKQDLQQGCGSASAYKYLVWYN